MSSPKFDRVKQLHPDLAELLDRLGRYIRVQASDGQQYIVPKLAAAALRLKDGEAFILLEMLAESGLLRRIFNVYCRKNNALLATVDSLDALDEIAHCDFCNCDHDSSELKVEVAFRLSDDGLKDIAA